MALKDLIKTRKRFLYILAGGIIVIGCLWAFISASVITHNFKQKIADQTYKNKEANIQSLLVTETKDGEKHWELYAETGTYSENNDIVLLEGIIGNFYDENAVKASVKADRGTYNNSTKEIILTDNIIMIYSDGTNIKADEIRYEGKDKDIIAERNVQIEKPNEAIIMGNKAILSGNYSDFRIEGRTQSKFFM